MICFEEWREQVGLADYRIRNSKPPRFQFPGRKLPKPMGTPNLPDVAKWASGAGSMSPSFSERKLGLGDLEMKKNTRKGLPRYKFSGDSFSNTKLDAGGDHRVMV